MPMTIRTALAIVGATALGLSGGAGCSDNSSSNQSGGDGGDASSSSMPEAGGASESGALDALADTGSSTADSSSDVADGGGAGNVVVYANSGTSLGVFGLTLADGTLTAKAPTAVPQIPQYADFDSTSRHLYLGATTGTSHFLYAYTIDQMSGQLTALGMPVASPNGRVINLTRSPDDKYLLTVHNVTKTYSVFPIGSDSTIGALLPQADGGDTNVGAYLHQVRVDPSGQYVTICDRGNDPATATTDAGTTMTPEDLGHLLVYSFSSGVLTPEQNITFPTGIGPRHLDFHPTQPWVYLSAERGNRLITYTFQNGMLTEKFNVSSLAVASDQPPLNTTEAVNGQRAGAIKVDPSGKYLWITNRNNMTQPDPGPSSEGGAESGTDAAVARDAAGAQDAAVADAGAPAMVFAGAGENNIALFSINQTTGEPTFVAAVDTHGIEPRTFTLDPTHQFLIVGNQKQQMVRQGAMLTTVLPNVAVFQVAAGGQLTFVKSYDQTSGEVVWVGSTAFGGR